MGGARNSKKKSKIAADNAAANSGENSSAAKNPLESEVPVEKKERKPLSPETRAAAVETRGMSKIFNKYLKSGSNRSVRLSAELIEVEAKLAAGSKIRNVPKMEKCADGKMRPNGSVSASVAFKPSERAALLQRKADLLSGNLVRKHGNLREEFLRVLPIYAEKKGFQVAVLRELGVSEKDLAEAGLI